MYPRLTLQSDDLVFSLELPPGLFRDTGAGIALGIGREVAVFRCLAEGPVLSVWTWALESAPSLAGALSPIIGDDGADALREAASGGPVRSHPGLAWKTRSDDWVRSRFALECDGVIVLASAEAPAELWDDYGSFAERAMMTIEVSTPSGPPKAPLRSGEAAPAEGGPVADPRVEEASAHRRSLDAAASAAAAMIARRDDEGAIRHVRSVDGDILGACRLAQLFEDALAAAPDAARADELYALARDWGWRSIPSPQTPVEAERHDEALAELEARLADIRGRAPG